MSAYQEFIEETERRQRRLARQQFWFRARRELRRRNLLWMGLFISLMAAGIALLLAAGLGFVR